MRRLTDQLPAIFPDEVQAELVRLADPDPQDLVGARKDRLQYYRRHFTPVGNVKDTYRKVAIAANTLGFLGVSALVPSLASVNAEGIFMGATMAVLGFGVDQVNREDLQEYRTNEQRVQAIDTYIDQLMGHREDLA